MKRLTALATAAVLLLTAAQAPAAGSAAATTGISPLDATEIQFSYDKLRTDFYKKTDPQEIVDGARDQLSHDLAGAGVKSSLPPIFGNDNVARTAQAVGHEVDVAARMAHGKISAHLLAYSAISGMLNSVHDRYTVFLSPKDYAALNQGLDGGSFAGTGIVIQ